MLPEFASKAWVTACTPANVLSGFAATGIWPINTDIFASDAFLGAEVSERPAPPAEGAAPPSPGPSLSSHDASLSSPGPSLTSPGPSFAGASSSRSSLTPEALRPYPKAPARPAGRGRKRVRACILTEDEEALAILREKDEKRRKKQEKKTTTAKRGRPKQRKVVAHNSSDEEVDDVLPQLDDSSEYSDEEVETEEQQPSLFQDRQAAVGDFVLVELQLEEGRTAGEKIHYVAKVLSVSVESGESGDSGDFDVSYARLSGKSGDNDTFYFPNIEDTGMVSRGNVLGVLCEPEKGKTPRLSNIIKFHDRFTNYNIH